MLREDRMLFTCVDTGDRMGDRMLFTCVDTGDRMLFKCHAALKKNYINVFENPTLILMSTYLGNNAE